MWAEKIHALAGAEDWWPLVALTPATLPGTYKAHGTDALMHYQTFRKAAIAAAATTGVTRAGGR